MINKPKTKRESKPIKYTRPKGNFKMGLHSRCEDFADVIEKHLKIRLKEETDFLIELSKLQANEEYVQWFETTEKRNPSLISKEVSRLTSRKNPIDFYSEEGKYKVGKSLLDSFIRTKRNEVINLRKALGLEHRKFTNKNIILTNSAEHSDLFRLFGSPLTIEELKANYRFLAKHCHSDLGGSDELMAKVNALYKRLEEKWDIYNPANLAIEEDNLQYLLKFKFESVDLINLLAFW